MITDVEYIKWGKRFFEDAKKIYMFQQKHLSIIDQIEKSLIIKYRLPEFYFSHNINFLSVGYTPFSGVARELRDYWLNYLMQNRYMFDQEISIEKGAKTILDSAFNEHIFKKFNADTHFSNGYFKINPTQTNKYDLNIRVPFSFNYHQVIFGIEIIEKITNYKVSKISLWYFTHQITSDLSSHFIIAVDDRIDKHQGHPYISKKRFLEFNIKSDENWYQEIPEFADYINLINSNTFECFSCGETLFSSGQKGRNRAQQRNKYPPNQTK